MNRLSLIIKNYPIFPSLWILLTLFTYFYGDAWVGLIWSFVAGLVLSDWIRDRKPSRPFLTFTRGSIEHNFLRLATLVREGIVVVTYLSTEVDPIKSGIMYNINLFLPDKKIVKGDDL